MAPFALAMPVYAIVEVLLGEILLLSVGVIDAELAHLLIFTTETICHTKSVCKLHASVRQCKRMCAKHFSLAVDLACYASERVLR